MFQIMYMRQLQGYYIVLTIINEQCTCMNNFRYADDSCVLLH